MLVFGQCKPLAQDAKSVASPDSHIPTIIIIIVISV